MFFKQSLCTYRLIRARRTLLRIVRWMRWHCPTDTGFEIRAMAVWGRARYLSVTEAPHNFQSLRVGVEKHIVSSKPEGQGGFPTRGHRLSQQAALTIAPGSRPWWTRAQRGPPTFSNWTSLLSIKVQWPWWLSFHLFTTRLLHSRRASR